MEELTTPFGERAMTLGMAAVQIAAQDKLKQLHKDKADNDAGSSFEDDGAGLVHKWKVLENITEAKEALGLTDRALAVLSALLSFHQETTLGSGSLIVFPSNAKLSQRAHGMSPATLRRHLASLVQVGVIIRRDSPNGKRYARTNGFGEIAQAYGFDLSPLITRNEEFEYLAEEARTRRQALRLIREKITLIRRDIMKNLMLVEDESIEGDWSSHREDFFRLSSRIRRTSTQEELEVFFEEFRLLATDLMKAIETHIKSLKLSGKESHFERHKQYQTQLKDSDINGLTVIKGEKTDDPDTEPSENAVKKHRLKGYTLNFVLETCPDILDYSLYEIRSWSDFIKTASLVRSMLGISPDAWREACMTIGELETSVIIACLLQKGEEIRSAGGYLRSLTGKAEAGQFNLGPLLMSLARKNFDEKQASF